MHKKPAILKAEQVARSQLFGIERVELRFSNGEERVYERLKTPDIPAVMIVALKEDTTVLLIREYACGLENYQLTLPKGSMDIGESVIEAANRELMEETGYGAKCLRELKQLSLAPGYMGHKIHVVLAEDLFERRLEGDEPEPLEVVEHVLDDMDSLVASDDFTEARALAALFIVRDIVRERSKG